jgi:hypothetical protein
MAADQFKLEPRYAVLKGTDIERYLNTSDRMALDVITRKINAGRAHDGKSELSAVVIESDWQPEFSAAVELIAARSQRSVNQLSNEQDE